MLRNTVALFKNGTPPKAQRFGRYRQSLAELGADALLPSLHAKYDDQKHLDPKTLPVSERVWHPPKVPKRKVNILRKEAIREGTFGSFDPETLKGWDPEWDRVLALKMKSTGRYMNIRVAKKTERVRTREERAQKIEAKMVGMDERMEELNHERIKNKPKPSVEQKVKEALKSLSRNHNRVG